MQLDETLQATQDSNAPTVDDQEQLLLAQFMQIAAAARQEQQLQQQQPGPPQHQRHEQQHHQLLQPIKRSATNDIHAPAVSRLSLPIATDHRTTAICAPSIPGQRLYGPEPGVRHRTFGNPPPNEHGHLRLVTHPAGRNVQFNKGVGVETFQVDGITGAPGEGVIERLEIAVHQANGAKPKEKSAVEVQQGERFLAATIRNKALPILEKTPSEQPSPGLNWWRIGGNEFRFIYGEASKTTEGRMDKGVVRCASWQLRYSQVKLDSEGNAKLDNNGHLDQKVWIIPGLILKHAENEETKEKNKVQRKDLHKRMRNVITLLAQYGCYKDSTGKPLGVKQHGMKELLTLATDVRVDMAQLATQAGLQPEVIPRWVEEFRRNGKRGAAGARKRS